MIGPKLFSALRVTLSTHSKLCQDSVESVKTSVTPVCHLIIEIVVSV